MKSTRPYDLVVCESLIYTFTTVKWRVGTPVAVTLHFAPVGDDEWNRLRAEVARYPGRMNAPKLDEEGLWKWAGPDLNTADR
ncbi:hypothetical protein J6590_017788 [Homalodisca vitripennis]|nr:hypothetical protein J6590_017788 [Homalodisca vitripennis]